MKRERPNLPTKAQVTRLVEAARAAGLKVAGFRVEADGAIVIFDKSAAPLDDFDKWDRARRT